MPKLRDQLDLGGATGNTKWKELRSFIKARVSSHIDLSGDPISRQCHRTHIELIVQGLYTAFPSLFSNPKRGESVRATLEDYIIISGNELRLRRRRIIEKRREKRLRDREFPPHPRPANPFIQQQVDGTSPQRHDFSAAGQSRETHLHGGLFGYSRLRKTDKVPAVAKPSPPVFHDSFRSSSIPGFGFSSGSRQFQHSPQASRPTREPVSDSEDEMALRPTRHTINIEHDSIHDFLASCKPRLTHLYPYLVGYGCTDMDYLKVMSEWSDGDLQVVLENVKAVEVDDIKPVKPIDWDILRHFIRKLNVQ